MNISIVFSREFCIPECLTIIRVKAESLHNKLNISGNSVASRPHATHAWRWRVCSFFWLFPFPPFLELRYFEREVTSSLKSIFGLHTQAFPSKSTKAHSHSPAPIIKGSPCAYIAMHSQCCPSQKVGHCMGRGQRRGNFYVKSSPAPKIPGTHTKGAREMLCTRGVQ